MARNPECQKKLQNEINEVAGQYVFILEIIKYYFQQPGKGEGEKHEIYEAAFGGHLFMTYFKRPGGGGRGGMAPRAPLDPLISIVSIYSSPISLYRTCKHSAIIFIISLL